MSKLLGGGSKKSSSTNTTEVILPDYIKGPLIDLIGRAEDLSLGDYPEYLYLGS